MFTIQHWRGSFLFISTNAVHIFRRSCSCFHWFLSSVYHSSCCSFLYWFFCNSPSVSLFIIMKSVHWLEDFSFPNIFYLKVYTRLSLHLFHARFQSTLDSCTYCQEDVVQEMQVFVMMYLMVSCPERESVWASIGNPLIKFRSEKTRRCQVKDLWAQYRHRDEIMFSSSVTHSSTLFIHVSRFLNEFTIPISFYLWLHQILLRNGVFPREWMDQMKEQERQGFLLLETSIWTSVMHQ